MELLLFIAFLIAGGLLNLIIRPAATVVNNIAAAYIVLALLISVCIWLFYFARIKNGAVLNSLSFFLTWGKQAGCLILGYLIINIWRSLKAQDKLTNTDQLKKLTRSTLWAVSILTGNIFLVATVGKAENMVEMTKFFTTSGYAVRFLYFIMTAETLGGLGVLLHSGLKTGPWAAAGLMLIMAGAVYTHWHNGDPFSDSYSAVIQFITLAILLAIFRFETMVNSKSPIPGSTVNNQAC